MSGNSNARTTSHLPLTVIPPPERASSGSNSRQESGAAQQVLTPLTRLYAVDVDFTLPLISRSPCV